MKALNLASQSYRESLPPAPAPDKELAKMRLILRNAHQRYRQLKEILAAEDILEAKRVKKVCLVVNLLLPTKEQDDKKAPARSGFFRVSGCLIKNYTSGNQKVTTQL